MTPYYEGDGVTLYHGDCLEVMPLLPGTVDAVIADLPYGTTRNEWDRELPNKLLWHQYRALCAERSPIILFGTGSFSARLIVENLAAYRYTLIWDKQAVSGFLNSRRQPLRSHEDLNVFYRKAPTYHPQMVYTGRSSHSRGTRRDRTLNHYGQHENLPVTDLGGWQFPRSILTFPRPKLPRGFGHPTQKPVALCEWLIRSYSDEGAVILDNVAGSGTTLVAARTCGRRAVGIEAREDYCEMAARRLETGSPNDLWTPRPNPR